MAQTILIVDDSVTHRSILKVFLGGRGFTFLEADDGQAGLEILERSEVSLVIADINMPKMNGLEFVTRVRASVNPKTSAVPIVILTGSHVREAKDAGANAWLEKPVSDAGVLDVVDRLLGDSPSDPAFPSGG